VHTEQTPRSAAPCARHRCRSLARSGTDRAFRALFRPSEARLVDERTPRNGPRPSTGSGRSRRPFSRRPLRTSRRSSTAFFGLDPVAIAVAAPESASAWHFVEFRPGPAHSLALAAQSPGPISVDAAAVSARECLGHSDGELRWSYGALPEEPIRDYCPGKESANRNPFESDEIDYRVLVIPEGQPFALASFRTSRRE
jgi:hypothetical protein